ncbi:cationic amino acid transporter 2, vacuolar isoform X2 [Amborella trichopoda]|uniref:cationic amino acid transporter 2, vacuolar isoform X2 n=1 Tax=Amborella trichopoda TaxID=13333 RepID=UPI0005D34A6C|nr:cationic amino acid transporter 2, vacuolar isoform X2 [Amborella trichopoda]|eukprot:XP_011624287.1 cationic amino acid transporter 2, vacuolar isoform X2 [Amborella trichopoda]
MGLVDVQNAGSSPSSSGSFSWGFQSLIRRKQVDSANNKPEGTQLAKELSILQLIALGVGSTIGAGVYVLVGTVAREHTGPALTISFLIAGIASALSAFCYAELASRCPSAGSAYHYSYICVGEGIAWIIGWALILEYTIGGSCVVRGISPNLAFFFGGEDSLPAFLARVSLPGTDIILDPCAAFLVLVVTGLLCVGIKESSFAQAVVTTANVCIMVFVIIAGGYLGFRNGWVGYSLPSGYFPFGFNGMLAGSATVFFSYIGFDTVASAAEEVKNPQRDLPLGIGLALAICCVLYMLVSAVIVGLVPYYAMDPDTPISSAFASQGMQWASYIITAGAVTALCANLMGSILPQVSVGTLLAFTVVAISILILRYVPPDEVPLPLSLQDSIDSVAFRYNKKEIDGNNPEDPPLCTCCAVDSVEHKALEDCHLHPGDAQASLGYPLIMKEKDEDKVNDKRRRKLAAGSIASVCIGVLLAASTASAEFLPDLIRISVGGVGAMLLLGGLTVLLWIDQDDGRHSFGHSGGFMCPFVPLLPVCSILINVYLLINLSLGTWVRVSLWLIIGVFIYLFYGMRHSSLSDAVYVPTSQADEIYRSSSEHLS